jgi:uncharacterized protein
MEPTQRRNSIFLMIGFIIVVLVMMYVFSLRSQLQEAKDDQNHYAQQIKSLSSVQNSDAVNVNREFLEKFFTYQTMADRYKNIKPLMTDRGFMATHPSGSELPHSDESVKSSIVNLKPFEYQSSNVDAEFLNEFELTTEFNNVSSTKTVIVKTSLIFVQNQGWKVDDVESIGNLTG